METVFNFIEHGKHHGQILVHCHKGISRSASFVIGYLMKKNEMTLEEALSHVQSVRPVAQPNNSFMEQLRRYEVLLEEQRQREKAIQESFDQKLHNSNGRIDIEDEKRIHKRNRVEVLPCEDIGPVMPPDAPHSIGYQPTEACSFP